MAFQTETMTTLSSFTPSMTLPPHPTQPVRDGPQPPSPGTSPPLILAFLAVGLFSAAMIFVFGRRGCRVIPTLRGPGVTPDEDDTDPMFPMDEEAGHGQLRTRQSAFLRAKRPVLWDVWSRLDGDLKTELGASVQRSSEKGSTLVTKVNPRRDEEGDDVRAKRRGAEWWLSVMPLAVRMYVFEDVQRLPDPKRLSSPDPHHPPASSATYPPPPQSPASQTQLRSPIFTQQVGRFTMPVPAIYNRFAPPIYPGQGTFNPSSMPQPFFTEKPEPVFDWTTLKTMKKMNAPAVPTMALEVAVAIAMPSPRCPVYSKRKAGADGDNANPEKEIHRLDCSSLEDLRAPTRRIDEYAIGLYEQPWMWER